jgi:hypothetical protein
MCRDLDNVLVHEYCVQLAEDIASGVWDGPSPVPDGSPHRIDTILTHDHTFDRYVLAHRDEVTDHQLASVLAMLGCAVDECGGITYRCVECGETEFVPFRCHGRVCPRCGKRYAEEWGRKLMSSILPVDHRHLIFTLPPTVWELVASDPGRLVNDLFEASRRTIERIFEDRFKKERVRPGIISVVHFTGRDMKWNPHIHMIVTEGGLTQGGDWKEHSYWPYMTVSAYWKYEVLSRLRFHLRASLDAKSVIDREWTRSFKDGTSGYVVKHYRDLGDMEGLGSYLARYVRHPPIGESRILGFDDEGVRIRYEWDNDVHETTVSTEDFVRSVLSNIPPKGYRVVRRYGLYSPTLSRWARWMLCGVVSSPTTLEIFMNVLSGDELACPGCGGVMEPMALEYVRNGRWEIILF